MARRLSAGLLTVFAALSLAAHVHAQDEGLEIVLDRSFGYQAGNTIQGTFRVRLRAGPSVEQAWLYLDGEEMAHWRQAPFEMTLSTSAYAPGTHVMSAKGVTRAGDEVTAPSLSLRFLSAEQAFSSAGHIVIPLLVLVLAFTAAWVLLPTLIAGRRRGFRPGEYGAAGGAVCRRCALPFSRRWLAPNLLIGRLEPCPHCGRWAVVAAAGQEELRAAEERWAADGHAGQLDTEDSQARMRRDIEDTRFDTSL